MYVLIYDHEKIDAKRVKGKVEDILKTKNIK